MRALAKAAEHKGIKTNSQKSKDNKVKQNKKITKKRDFTKICKGAYHFGRDIGCDIGCDTSNCVTKVKKNKKKNKITNEIKTR